MFYKAAYLAQLQSIIDSFFSQGRGEKDHIFSMDKDSKTIDIVYEDIQVIDFTFLVKEGLYDQLKPAVIEEKLVN